MAKASKPAPKMDKGKMDGKHKMSGSGHMMDDSKMSGYGGMRAPAPKKGGGKKK